MMKSNPDLKIGVEGHTDNVGSPASNKTLSEARAKSVVSALVAQGISADRLTPAGYGQDNPVADNNTEEGRAKNRRVELIKK
jgi:outer membrane protein OmpA-like peptidoglycan-associated protein